MRVFALQYDVCRYAHPREYDAMKREVTRLWQAQQPVVDAAQRELQVRRSTACNWVGGALLLGGKRSCVLCVHLSVRASPA